MLLRVAALAAVVSMPALAAQTPSDAFADEAAVKEVVRRYMNARELNDPKAIERLFTADADQHTTSGEWRRGRDRIVPGTIESSRRNPGDRSITVSAVRFVTPDVAIADGPYDITGPGGTRRMWATIVLKREADGWRIAAIRNMVPTGSGTPAPR